MNFVNSQLFKDVQLAEVFADSKMFADAVPNLSWQSACELYQLVGPLRGDELRKFVMSNFVFADQSIPTAKLDTTSVKQYILDLWPHLHRNADTDLASSLMPLEFDYIVPGGRFQEIYYWDSYFTALGLEDIGDLTTIEAMVNNFIDLQERNGCIPNGNRVYYSSRSQPPVLALMLAMLWDAKYKHEADITWLANAVKALEAEYQFWMQGCNDLSSEKPAIRRVVKMPNKAILNRYWDSAATPRPESLKEDLHDAEGLTTEQQQSYFQHIRAACESGWDFSSRWLSDHSDLKSIETTNIIPVDLNSLLYNLEHTLSRFYRLLGEEQKSQSIAELATLRLDAINTYCWNSEAGVYRDYNIRLNQQSSVDSMAMAVPLFVGAASVQQAQQVKQKLMSEFLKPGGLVTTLCSTPQQWDSPNGWAPLQWFAVKGLIEYGFVSEAQAIMKNWVSMIEMRFAEDKCLLEKYNVCELVSRAGGGEYIVQQGFGWTNGVTSRFYKLIDDKF
ncbi:alpha,alpha-trehalase [Pseudoalteromonas shioyasakiensis]|jgi:alpha,alpha-trehalase|uniref:trehalase family glycosidase n=1 Tax=Pseudoalteromonas shioyasakiensis TaxID=1190813 RepID=UPI0020954679|nr:trehalase family glycosidase [Pseudoalteromonas shioyasakiensis]MCO6356067.1 alpha,alpha-trehalase [Pseudoalteromonas shioyasakiensis]